MNPSRQCVSGGLTQEEENRQHKKTNTKLITTRRGGRRKQKKSVTSQQSTFEYINEVWGDDLQLDSTWPTNMNTVRLVGSNLGGISSDTNYIDWEILLHQMKDLQVDVFCFSELNLNLHNPTVYDNLQNHKKRIDKFMSLSYTCNRPTNYSAEYQPGGVMIGVDGRRSGNIVKPKLEYPVSAYGRWSILHLQGKKNTIVSIITIYRVGGDSATGKNTIDIQQRRDYQHFTGKLINARNQYTNDISTLVTYLHSQYHHVILAGDVNEDLNDRSSNNTWRSMLETCNMQLVTDMRFGNTTLPHTYDRGTKCLDMVAISTTIDPSCITAVGYLPFGHPILSDHRPIYIDIDENKLFASTLPDLTKSTFKGFSMKNGKQTKKYLNILHRHFDNNNIYKRIRKLKQTILASKTDTRDSLILECQQLDVTVTELMINAEKSLYKGRYTHSYWSSKSLTEAAQAVIKLKKQRRYISLHWFEDQDQLLATKSKDIQDAIKTLRQRQRNAPALRDEMMVDTIDINAQRWKVSTSQAKKIILKAEQSERMFAKMGKIMKPPTSSSLKSLMVPRPCIDPGVDIADDDDPSHRWTTIQDPESIFYLTLKQNASSLMRSAGSVFSTGPIGEKVGSTDTDQEFITSLFNGTIDSDLLSQAYPDVSQELSVFLSCCQKKASTNDFDWDFGIQEYCQLFNKTRESTACGPSGLHMSHWCVATLDENIAEVHAFLIWASFYLSFVYPRWLISWHCMLLKKKYPYINKLRIIQLFEGDFNGALKYLLGRLMMRHIVKSDEVDVTTFGSIPGRDAIEAMGVLQQLYDNHRLFHRSMVAMFNDAAGCYDRIRVQLAEICLRRLGCPENIAKTHTKAQQGMIHRIKTALGISPGTIRWANSSLIEETIGGIKHFKGKIGGIGQGGGASPVGWFVILLVMIESYREFSPGAQLINPLNYDDDDMHVVSYVDDNTLLRTFHEVLMSGELFQTLSKELTHWWNLLRLTGGDLALEKCTCSIMAWKWDGTGQDPELRTSQDFPGTIEMTPDNGTTIPLTRLEPHRSERQLGIRMPLDGTWDEEYLYRLRQMQQLSQRIFYGPLTAHEALLAYQIYLMPVLRFPLHITLFTPDQCENINKQIYNNVLPKCGINRKTPRALIFAPTSIAGFGFHHVWSLQLALHLSNLQRHIRRGDALGKAFLGNCNMMQKLLGRSSPFLSYNPTTHTYVNCCSSIGYIWIASHSIEVHIIIPKLHIQNSTAQPGDDVIMDTAMNDSLIKANHNKLVAINKCRLYHGIYCLSDMMHYDGKGMNKGFLSPQGGRRIDRKLISYWPVMPAPTEWQWNTWKSFVYRHWIKGDGTTSTFSPFERSFITQSVDLKAQLEKFLSSQYSSITSAYSDLPPTFKSIIGTVSTSPGASDAIRHALLKNTIISASDGSYHSSTNTGSFSFILLSKSHLNQPIYGGNMIPSHPHLNSQRTEHYGAISVLLCILSISTLIPQVLRPTVVIPIYTDNMKTYQRLMDRPPPDAKITMYSTDDYDLWALIILLCDLLPCQIIPTWVKAHQDRNCKDPSKLTLDAKLNITAHNIAASLHSHPLSTMTPYPVDTDGIFITHHNAPLLHLETDIPKIIHERDHINYVCAKWNWSFQLYLNVHWQSLSTALSQFHGTTRLYVLQLLYNWQNTGYQKYQFSQSRQCNILSSLSSEKDNTPAIEKLQFQCPMCQCEIETPLHYVFCPYAKSRLAQAPQKRQLRQQMQKLHTYEGIQAIILYTLVHGNNDAFHHTEIHATMRQLLQEAITAQSQLGWKAFLKGFWHTSWFALQRQHCLFLKIKFDGPTWGSKVIKSLLTILWDSWKFRNDFLHSTNDDDDVKRKLLVEKVRALYTDKARWYFNTPEKRKLFQMPIMKRLRLSNVVLESWVDLVETRLRLDRENRARLLIVRWIEKGNSSL